MFKISDYKEEAKELELKDGEVIHVNALIKKDVDKFINIAKKLEKKNDKATEADGLELYKVVLKILSNNIEGKEFSMKFFDEYTTGEFKGFIEFIMYLISDTEKKPHSQSQTMK